ncbi:nitroreductase family protein [Candidatus Desulfovibrio trichonymphae]|uniref:Putative NAD(P)H-dependent FMN reductase n=1 Tax=Candidatus Desulfovibrio trichonymphae TaxID=1725232 RepID=A0A1J1DTV0_9BACT|nr:nitroreductase family protein [Candidatus Desulfovibrio trichonymphae]BAV92101.1 putative NAD(P)H-dependent FMN reductase [Candidatus Desulfovibrio trichonymphae]GHU91913.1 nitroreductase [Deltaproteobacteria bacterium]GHU94634.1 nitroreductase [Deltaproteobacteria bacterium]GHU99784.1 nitroreductase [Deltaproteobacteria bacterium]
MDMFEAIFTRRSIRKYTTEPVSDEDVTLLLKAAMLAPSAHNCRPWHFVVVRDAAVRKSIAERHPYAKMAAEAPVVIVVCANLNEEKEPGFWVQDCSAATENIMLAARGKNLGTVWCGLHPMKDRAKVIRETLNLPSNIMPLSIVVIGHPAEAFSEANRYNAEKIHYDRWQ